MDSKLINFKVPIIIEATGSEHPLITKMSFVFVDNEPNANMQGVPIESFAALVASGTLMPIKMEKGKIGDHKSAEPLGVIEHLEVDATKVIGHAVLWNEERPSDIALIKELHASEDSQVNISFEVKYSEYSIDDGGVEWILDPVVRGATIVTTPAYAGRTPVLAIASKKEYSNLSDSCFMYIAPGGDCEDGFTNPRNLRAFPYRNAEGTINEELLRKSIEELNSLKEEEFAQKDEIMQLLRAAKSQLKKEQEKEMTEQRIQELEEAQATLRTEIEELISQVETLTTERDELTTWKEEKEHEEAQATLLKERLNVLAEAGFEYTKEQIETKSGFWVTLEDDAFAIYVAELKELKAGQASNDGKQVPNLSSSASDRQTSLDDLLDHLRGEDN